jgi:hypothetical protein
MARPAIIDRRRKADGQFEGILQDSAHDPASSRGIILRRDYLLRALRAA